MSVCISFPLLNMFTHRRIKAARFRCGSFVRSFLSMHSKASSFANMAKSSASR